MYTMVNNYTLEVKRKLFHLISVPLWLIPVLFLPKELAIILMLLVLLINLAILLKVGEARLRWLYSLVYSLERDKNFNKPAVQALWLNVGVLLSFLLFGKCAVPGIIVLAVGDTFSTLVGMKYGKRKILGRSLEGSSAFILSSFLVLIPFYGYTHALVFSLVGSLAELLSKKVDDNLSIPLFVAIACQFFSALD